MSDLQTRVLRDALTTAHKHIADLKRALEWSNRPAPELPEGYTLDEDGDLVGDKGCISAFDYGSELGDLTGPSPGIGSVMVIDSDGDIIILNATDVYALSFWLQRRQAAKPPETGTQTSKESK